MRVTSTSLAAMLEMVSPTAQEVAVALEADIAREEV